MRPTEQATEPLTEQATEQATTTAPPEMGGVDGLFTISQAARILGLRRATLYARLRKQGKIMPRRLGQRVWTLTSADVLRLWEDEYVKMHQ